MKWNAWVRQIHRWVSVAFTLAVGIVTILVATGGREGPAEWVYYMPLPPLALLLFTGLYLFAMPYAIKWRRGAHS